jgi:putative glycosyltransferase (TIGR04348 family)
MSAALDIQIVTPAAPGSRVGNRVTAERWRELLVALGHRVGVTSEYDGADCDLLIAVHARRSAAAAAGFREAHPDRPLIVALAGTDLYRDIHDDQDAQRTLEIADRLIVLHPRGADDLPAWLRPRVRVVVQSVALPALPDEKAAELQVCVIANLREVKDPLRAAAAARLLPASSRIRIVHVGAVLEGDFAAAARAEETLNPRYAWLGELPRPETLRALKRSHLHVISSRMEGGSNALSEAVACGVPSLCSRISASVGILGRDYPGFFPVGDTRALADLMGRFETERGFRATLQRRTDALAELVDPNREQAALAEVIGELQAAG